VVRWIVGGALAAVVIVGGVAAFAAGGNDGGSTPVLITAKAIQRDLRDEVTVAGTLGRVEERTVNAPASASASTGGVGATTTVSKVYVKDGATMEADQPILALDGRDSITENGDVAFFRRLDVGATGVDVVQLEQILKDAGFSPGKIDQLYTEQTRSALAQWQAAHLYAGANAQAPQTVTVALQPGTGYKVGEQSSAATTIGPYVPKTNRSRVRAKRDSASRSKGFRARSGAYLLGPCPPGSPMQVTITANPTTVQAGGAATFTVTASGVADPLCPPYVSLAAGGDATPGVDYATFSPTLDLSSGSAQLTVQTLAPLAAGPDRHLAISVAPSASGSYTVGSPSSATVTITHPSPTPVVTLTPGVSRVSEGQPAQFTLGLNAPLTTPLQVNLNFSGNAVAGADYNRPAGAIIIPAGSTSLPVVVPTLDDGQVEPDRTLNVSIAASSAYQLASPNGGAVVIVSEDVPKIQVVGGGNVSKGGGAGFHIIADQPPLVDTTVQYSATGTAKQGVDVNPLTGTVLLRAGTTTANVPLYTLNTNVFFVPTDMIVAHWPTHVSKTLVSEGDIVPAGTPLFSITQVGFEVTLEASAADRSELEVGQQVTVKVQGGDTSAPGVITQLDDNATIDKDTKQQTYEGKVQVQGDLGAADGTPVTIDVVLEDRPGVLTVPIAAVKQNGAGQDVVRVIDLARGGRIKEREVKTGLSEGSYIEIKTGLRGNEVVVVEVNQGSG